MEYCQRGNSWSSKQESDQHYMIRQYPINTDQYHLLDKDVYPKTWQLRRELHREDMMNLLELWYSGICMARATVGHWWKILIGMSIGNKEDFIGITRLVSLHENQFMYSCYSEKATYDMQTHIVNTHALIVLSFC